MSPEGIAGIAITVVLAAVAVLVSWKLSDQGASLHRLSLELLGDVRTSVSLTLHDTLNISERVGQMLQQTMSISSSLTQVSKNVGDEAEAMGATITTAWLATWLLSAQIDFLPTVPSAGVPFSRIDAGLNPAFLRENSVLIVDDLTGLARVHPGLIEPLRYLAVMQREKRALREEYERERGDKSPEVEGSKEG